jgi:hypothetical protein
MNATGRKCRGSRYKRRQPYGNPRHAKFLTIDRKAAVIHACRLSFLAQSQMGQACAGNPFPGRPYPAGGFSEVKIRRSVIVFHACGPHKE